MIAIIKSLAEWVDGHTRNESVNHAAVLINPYQVIQVELIALSPLNNPEKLIWVMRVSVSGPADFRGRSRDNYFDFEFDNKLKAIEELQHWRRKCPNLLPLADRKTVKRPWQ